MREEKRCLFAAFPCERGVFVLGILHEQQMGNKKEKEEEEEEESLRKMKEREIWSGFVECERGEDSLNICVFLLVSQQRYALPS